ncbi:MAG: glycosyltransferase family 9 protein [Chloroherpetonaceae bacterium]
MRLLVIRLSSIGDILLTTPILRALKATFQEAEIDFLTKPSFTALLEGNPALKTIFTTENFEPKQRYDLVIDLQHNLTSRKYHQAGKKIVCYHKENWKKFLLVNFKVNLYRGYESVVERYAKSLAPFGVRLDEKGCEVFLNHEEKDFGKKHRTAKTPVLAVCFGARHVTKRFPPERFASALNQLLEKNPIDIWLLGGKEDAPTAEEILSHVRARSSVKNFSGQHTLRETAAMLASSDAVLSNDTGLMHMAAAFQKPMVVLFGSSVKEFGFLPYKSAFELLEVEGLECRPCSHIGREHCPKLHFKCMRDISESGLVNAVENALKRSGSNEKQRDESGNAY